MAIIILSMDLYNMAIFRSVRLLEIWL